METDKKTGMNILKAYMRYLRLQRGFSPNTLDAYQRDLDKLLNYLRMENRDVLEVTLEDLQHFAAGLHDIGIHARSQCRILSGVRQFFHFLQLDGFREDDPSEPRSTCRNGRATETVPLSRCCSLAVYVLASWCS